MDAAVGTGQASPFFWNAEVRPGLRVAFTSVAAGNLALHVGSDGNAVLGNRRRLEALMGVPTGALRFMSQTHSDRVTVVDPAAPDAPDADGMISADGGQPLAVLVADCVPVVLADASVPDGGTGATAVVHAGRAGVGNGIVANAVRGLRARGADDITAWIGPSVCGSCYEVPADLVTELARILPAAASRTRGGTPALDLPAAVRGQLEDAGAAVEHVGGGDPCTLENTSLYSHRREPGAGRIAGLVWRT